MELAFFVEWIIKAVLMLAFLIVGFAYTTYLERKTLARMQVRYGPNRAGPFGLLQPVADGVKLIFKEELIPKKADKLNFYPRSDPDRNTRTGHAGSCAIRGND